MLFSHAVLLGMFLLPVISVFGIGGCCLWLLPTAEIPSLTR